MTWKGKIQKKKSNPVRSEGRRRVLDLCYAEYVSQGCCYKAKPKTTKCQALLLEKLIYISHIVKQIMECSHCRKMPNYFPLALEGKHHCLAQKMKLSKCSFYRCPRWQKCFLQRSELENDIEINLEDR